MRNARLEEAQSGIKIAGTSISNLRYTDDTTLLAESEEELKSFLMKGKEESENVGLKLNIQKTKIVASSPISSVQFSHSVMSDSLRPHEPQCTRLPCPSPTPRAYSNSPRKTGARLGRTEGWDQPGELGTVRVGTPRLSSSPQGNFRLGLGPVLRPSQLFETNFFFHYAFELLVRVYVPSQNSNKIN